MRTPLTVITGVDDEATARVLVGLLWDLPSAVTVQHHIDPEAQVLTRTVSDATGVLETELIELEHACVSCAIREDVVPTLERLARSDRWQSIVACLPVAAEADQLATVLAADTRLARHLRLTSVVAALAGDTAVDDLLGDDLLRERQRHTGPDDDRGHGEVLCAQVEQADVVVLVDSEGRASDPVGVDLVQALARPGASVVVGADQLSGAALLEPLHSYEQTTGWAGPYLPDRVPPLATSRVWRLHLDSPRAFHPERLLDDIERLGAGRHRSRGSFWLPTRPQLAQVWDGCGGQLSIGADGPWRHDRAPRTRLLLTGVGAPPEDLLTAFRELVLTAEEAARDLGSWAVAYDGFEPWLGEIRDVA